MTYEDECESIKDNIRYCNESLRLIGEGTPNNRINIEENIRTLEAGLDRLFMDRYNDRRGAIMEQRSK